MFLLSSVFVILYAAGDDDAVIPDKVYRLKDFDLNIKNFKADINRLDDEA